MNEGGDEVHKGTLSSKDSVSGPRTKQKRDPMNEDEMKSWSSSSRALSGKGRGL